MADGQVWCGVPVYNNVGTIVDVVKRCRQQLVKVVVVDDGSSDADLRELLKELDVVVIRHPTNLGKGAALLSMFHHAAEQGGEYLVALDADGQHFPEDIPKFLDRLEPRTIIIGRRDEVSGVMPKSSLFGREFSDFWVCVETGAQISDTQSGFRAYPLRGMLGLKLADRHYSFEIEVITRAIWKGMNVLSVPIRVWYPEVEKRVSSFRPVVDNLRLSWMHTRLVLQQLLPIPRRRINRPAWLEENATPLGLAAAAGVSALLSVVWGLIGVIVVFYLAWRLHLNKIMVLASLLLCMSIGEMILPHNGRGMRWFIEAHLLGFSMAAVMALVTYRIARWIQHEYR
jgi:glycosyltransferase involved in cell wall biosynthesis